MSDCQKVTEIGLELKYIAERSSVDNLYRQVFGYWPEVEYTGGNTEIIEMIIACPGHPKHSKLLGEFFGIGVARRETFCGSEYRGIMIGLEAVRKYHAAELGVLYEYSAGHTEQAFMRLLKAHIELKRARSNRKQQAKQFNTQLDITASVAKKSSQRMAREEKIGSHLQYLGQINFDDSIEVLGLSSRSLGCLLRYGIKTVGELLAKTSTDLMSIRYFGLVALEEVQSVLRRNGLDLRSPGQDVTKE